MPQLVFVVGDTVTIGGRGLALTPGFPGIWGSGEAVVGDTVEIRADGAASLAARIQSLDWQPRNSDNRNLVKSGWIGLVVFDLPSGSAKRGDEVWTVKP